jgi:hypothetical protein
MRKISFWRYSAVNRKNLFAALACALLVFSLLGCGATNHLQSIQLSSSNTSEAVTGTISLGINGAVIGPVQLYTWGNYSNGKSVLLHGTGVVYQIAINPDNPSAVDPSDGSFYPLAAPPDTMELSTTGLLTAVEPSACSWLNSAAGTKATTPAWSTVGSYLVTATYSGFTTPPVSVAVASAPGVFDINNNTSGACGPTK